MIPPELRNAILLRAKQAAIFDTLHMSIRFLAPCLSEVQAKARVIKSGRTLCPVAVDLFDTAHKHVAVARVNYILLDKMPAR